MSIGAGMSEAGELEESFQCFNFHGAVRFEFSFRNSGSLKSNVTCSFLGGRGLKG